MDPVLFSLPEIILKDSEEPDHTLSSANLSPRYHQPWPADKSALREAHDTRELSEAFPQRSHEIFSRVGLVMDESASLGAPTVAKTLGGQGDSNQQSSIVQPQIQAQDCPSPLHQKALPPGACPVSTEFLYPPCSPPDSCWLNMSLVASTPNSPFGFSPYVLVPISRPTQFRFSPCSPPGSCHVLPEVQPSWCLCHPAVPVHQACSPGL